MTSNNPTAHTSGISPSFDMYPNGKPPDWAARRQAVYNRDNYTCQICDQQSKTQDDIALQVDHKIPYGDGGTHKISNLTTVCGHCTSIDPIFELYPGEKPPDWDARRRAVLQRDDHSCQECGSGPQSDREIQVHHRNQHRSFKDHKLIELVTICDVCVRNKSVMNYTQNDMSFPPVTDTKNSLSEDSSTTDPLSASYSDQSAPDWETRRRAVYDRDSYTCQKCGMKGGDHVDNNVVLHVHNNQLYNDNDGTELSDFKTRCENCDKIDATFDFYPNGYPPDWDARRRAVYRRDGYTCQHCGILSGPHVENGVPLHAHHETPKSEYGSHMLDNLVTLCEQCHNNQHTHDFVEAGVGSLASTETPTNIEASTNSSIGTEAATEDGSIVPYVISDNKQKIDTDSLSDFEKKYRDMMPVAVDGVYSPDILDCDVNRSDHRAHLYTVITENKQFYVGKAKRKPVIRWEEHLGDGRFGTGGVRFLQNKQIVAFVLVKVNIRHVEKAIDKLATQLAAKYGPENVESFTQKPVSKDLKRYYSEDDTYDYLSDIDQLVSEPITASEAHPSLVIYNKKRKIGTNKESGSAAQTVIVMFLIVLFMIVVSMIII